MSELLVDLPIRGPLVLRDLRNIAEERLGIAHGPLPAAEQKKLELAMVAAARGFVDEGLQDCTIAIVRLRQSPKCFASTALAEGYRLQGLRHLFVLLGEENEPCAKCRSFFEAAPFVVRHYHSTDCAQYGGRVLTVPMGLQRPMRPGLDMRKVASGRRYAWSFASGHATRDRQVVAAFFAEHHAREEVRLVYPGVDPEYMEHLCNSKFALCPRGNHEDTWRLHEALSCGAIPVVTDGGEYFSRYLPVELTRHFVVVDAILSRESLWTAAKEMDALLASEATLDERQRLLLAARDLHTSNWRAQLRASRIAIGMRSGSLGSSRGHCHGRHPSCAPASAPAASWQGLVAKIERRRQEL